MIVQKELIGYFDGWLRKIYNRKSGMSQLFTREDMLEAYCSGFLLNECLGVKGGKKAGKNRA